MEFLCQLGDYIVTISVYIFFYIYAQFITVFCFRRFNQRQAASSNVNGKVNDWTEISPANGGNFARRERERDRQRGERATLDNWWLYLIAGNWLCFAESRNEFDELETMKTQSHPEQQDDDACLQRVSWSRLAPCLCLCLSTSLPPHRATLITFNVVDFHELRRREEGNMLETTWVWVTVFVFFSYLVSPFPNSLLCSPCVVVTSLGTLSLSPSPPHALTLVRYCFLSASTAKGPATPTRAHCKESRTL